MSQRNSRQPPEIVNWNGDEPAYSDDGVDLTLIRWMLSLTPAERLEAHQKHINAVLEVRRLNGYDE